MKCIDDVIESVLPCQNVECRYHLDYPNDLNCTHIAIIKIGKMKLGDIGNRLHLSIARIKQIEDKTFNKLKKNNKLKILMNE